MEKLIADLESILKLMIKAIGCKGELDGLIQLVYNIEDALKYLYKNCSDDDRVDYLEERLPMVVDLANTMDEFNKREFTETDLQEITERISRIIYWLALYKELG